MEKEVTKTEDANGKDQKIDKENVKEHSFGNEHNYELIDNVYYYTDNSTNIRYKYENERWEEVKENESNTISDVTTDSEGRQYYSADGMYLCRDTGGNVFYMDKNNEWKPWNDTGQKEKDSRWYFYKGDDTFYRDNTTNKIYKLNKESNEWEIYSRKNKRKRKKNEDEEFDTDDDDEEVEDSLSEDEQLDGVPPGYKSDPNISYDGNTYIKHDPSDNTTYEWDSSKKAWFPKIDEDFMASYQLSYGFNPDGTKNENPVKYDDDIDEDEEIDKKEELEKEQKKVDKTERKKPGWFDMDDAHNTKVYVSNLPHTITEDQFVDFMQKCGLVLKDPETQKFKIKLYKDTEGNFKGDALCTYIKKESVDLALQILDGYRYDSNIVKVEIAKFTLKGDYNPSLKPKKKRKEVLAKIQKKQEKLFAWAPDPMRGQRAKHENVVIARNVFDPSEFDSNAELILTHKEEIRCHAETFGSVQKIELFDRHPDGVVKITFVEVESADMCVATLNNRLYKNRSLKVATWDGVEKYKVQESEEEKTDRLKKWDKFLEGKEDEAKT